VSPKGELRCEPELAGVRQVRQQRQIFSPERPTLAKLLRRPQPLHPPPRPLGRAELQIRLGPGHPILGQNAQLRGHWASLKDLQDIVHELKGRGVALKATEQPVDTGTAAGKAFLDMLGVFAEFETNLRRERQLEGISAAKARGVYKGRKPSIDAAEVQRLRSEEKLGAGAIARRLGIGRASVYRVLGKQAEPVAADGGGHADQA
jgi:hypothetical protein